MNKISLKMVVIDLDGTLLNDNKIISSRNKKALKALQEMGVIVVFASGRTNFMMSLYKYPYVVCDYHISFNGGMIEELKTGNIIKKVAINPETSMEVWKYLSAKAKTYTCYTEKMMYFTDESKSKIRKKINNYTALAKQEKINLLPNMNELERREIPHKAEQNVLKFVAYEEDLGWITDFEDFTNAFLDLRIEATGYGLTGVFDQNVSKESAIRTLCEKLNISTTEVAAFGDYDNDLNMFNVAGIKVAMQNATQELKNYADYICPNNNNDGIAQFIEEYVF